MTGCPSKLVPLGFELPLGGFKKGHRPFPPYLSLFIIFPLIHPLHRFGHWVCQASKGLYLTLWEEGAKGPKGKSSWQKIKAKRTKPSDASPKDPRESNKRLSARNGGTHNIIKSRPSWRIGVLITSQPIRSMGM
jgi:hypothetical protein